MTAVRDLPAPLPPGERLLWQGQPSWRALARRAFHLPKVAAYFGLLLVWHLASSFSAGRTLASAALPAFYLVAAAAILAGLLALLAWLFSRATVYTITDRRVVIRFGVALPVTLNIPFRIVGSAALKAHADGTGDLPLALTGEERVSYLLLWPNVRPWRLARPEPMLRAVPEAARVAQILAEALAAADTTPRPVAAAA